MSSFYPPGLDLATTPAAAPPSGQVSNFINPVTQDAAITGVSTVLMTITFFMVCIRLFTNFRAAGKLRLDDYFCIIATVLSFTYTAIILSLNNYARHLWDVSLNMLTASYSKRIFSQAILLGPSIYFAKTSIFLLFLRIFQVNKATKWAIYFGMAFTFALYWTNIGVESAFCAPKKGQSWADPNLVGKSCARTEPFGITQGTLATVLDIYIFILPIPVVSRLQMSTQRKFSILIIFATAFFGIVASALALTFRILVFKRADQTWYTSSLFLCVIVENFVAIIVSCMPACASFAKTNFSEFTFASLRTKLFSSTKSSKRTIPSSVTAVGTGQTDSQTNLRDGQYYQLKERSGLFGSGNSKTVIEAQKSSTPPPGITKSVGVEQFSAHREEV